jgi:hypothetical protein
MFDQGSMFNFQLCTRACAYISFIYIYEKPKDLSLCFSWILLQNKLSRQSTSQGSVGDANLAKLVTDSSQVVKLAMVCLAYSRLGEGHKAEKSVRASGNGGHQEHKAL